MKGVALLILLWINREALIPCDFWVYDKPIGGKTKNDHFQAMLFEAKGRGFEPEYVLMDCWYSGLENLKLIASLGWCFLSRLKSNRMVNPDGKRNVLISSEDIPKKEGKAGHLRGFVFVKVFRTVSKKREAEYWITNDLKMPEEQRAELAKQGWGIEVYHHALKQYCGAEKAGVRKAVALIKHLLLSIRAFLRLEVYRLRTGISW